MSARSRRAEAAPTERAPRRPRISLRSLGGGVVAGASDIDPTTVGTLAVVGATTAFRLSWLTWLLFR